MIEIKDLTKAFGPLLAVDHVSFAVEPGEVLGFLGPNGAGKSTTMKMITGFLAPTSGEVRVFGHDVAKQPVVAKAKLGYLPEGAPGYADMTPLQFLQFIADVRGLSGEHRRKRLDRVIRDVHIEDVLHQPIDTLSKGFRRRVGLAQSILHDPPALILDEPTDGLDPNQKHEVRELIQEMAKDKLIVISTHILEEVRAVCSRAVIIAQGRVVADATPAELEAQSRYNGAITLQMPGFEQAAERLKSLGGVRSVELDAGLGSVTAFAEGDADLLPAVEQLARDNNWDVRQIYRERGRLDDVFRQITQEVA